MSNKLLLFLMIMAMIAWGETWVSAKILNSYLPSSELVFWRFLFTAIGLLPLVFYFKDKVDLKLAFISGILLFFYNLFFFLGTKYGLASIGGVLVTTLNPIVTFILIALLYRKKLKKIEIFGLILGFLGSFLILGFWKFGSEIFNKGNIFYILASFTWPILTIVSSKNRSNAITFSFFMFVFTSLISLIFLGFKVHNIFKLDFKFWLNMFLLSFYATSFATTIYFLGVKRLGSKIASAFFFLVPVSAIVFSTVFLKEKITLNLVIGGILSIMAVYLINRK